MLTKSNKRGQISSGLVATAILFGALLITLAVMTNIQQTVTDTQVSGTASETVINESVTWSNNTVVPLSRSPGAASITCSAVLNNNTGWTSLGTTQASLAIISGNWSCDQSGLRLSENNATHGNFMRFNFTRIVNVTYTFKPATYAYNHSTNSLLGETSMSAQSGNIGTVVAIVAIIGILMSVAMVRRRV